MHDFDLYYTVKKSTRTTDRLSVSRTVFDTVKILFDHPAQLVKAINELEGLVDIVSIRNAVPDSTTTKHCVSVYYERYC